VNPETSPAPESSTPAFTPPPWTITNTGEELELRMGSSLGHPGHWESQHYARLDWSDLEDESDEQWDEALSNACLIAAAPDLYMALQWAVEYMEDFEGEVMPGWREWAVQGRQALDVADGGRTLDDLETV